VKLQFDANRKSPGPDSVFLYYSTNGTTWTVFNGTAYNASTSGFTTFGPLDFTGLTAVGTTYFRYYGFGANNPNTGADLNLDNVTFTGCGMPQPLTLTKGFQPNPIAVNSTSRLTFTVVNSNSVTVTAVLFTDNLPSGVQVAAPPAASTSGCGSPTFNPLAGATMLTFTNGTILGNGRCTLTVTVTALTAGPHVNISGVVSSTETGPNTGPGGSAVATLTAVQPPVISKNFATDPILAGGLSLLTFALVNPNSNDALASVAFTDTLPTTPGAMLVASPPLTATAGCGSPTFNPLAGATALAFSNGTIAAGGTCLITVTVTAPTAGVYTNTTGAVVALVAGVPITGNTALDTLTVNQPHPGLALGKQVAISSTGPWTSFVVVAPGANIYYRLIIENIGDVPLSPVTVTDPDVNLAGCVWPGTLPVASPTQDPTAQCTLGPLAAQSGDILNTATAQGVFTGTVVTATASAEYLGAVPGLNLVKQVALTNSGPWETALTGVAPGSNLYYKFIVINNGGVTLTTLSVIDSLLNTAGCVLIDPLAAGGATTCTLGPIVAVSNTGTYTNTATAQGFDGNTPVESEPASASYTLAAPDLSLSKANNTAGTIVLGATFTWTLTVSNTGTASAVFADGDLILSDPLPANATYGAPTVTNPVNVINSANIACAITAGTLACSASGAAVTVGAAGGFAVAYTATPTATGSLTNTATVDPDALISEINESNNTGTDVVTATAPTTLGGFVWFDVDQDGQQDGGELGLTGVLVTLLTPTDTLTTTTDAGGLYTFTNLISGTFLLTFTAPLGFTPTVQNVGNDATDSDADPTTGQAGPISLVNNQVDRTWAAGYWQPATAIELASFTATADAQGRVTVQWTTAVEIDTAGFNLYRASSVAGPPGQLNALLIAAVGSFGGGADYAFLDQPGVGVWYYWLEDVDTQGHPTQYGPVTVRVGSGPASLYRVFLPLVSR